jgi:hypothetical protein
MPLHVSLFWRAIVFPFIDRPSMNNSLAQLKAKRESCTNTPSSVEQTRQLM